MKLSSLAKPPILRPIELEDFKQALSQVLLNFLFS